MNRTELHTYQRNTLGDEGTMRALVEDKKAYDDMGGMLPEEVETRHILMAFYMDPLAEDKDDA